MITGKVSIIIPVYNCEEHLNKCLNSVLAQSYTDWELILVDDGSTDNSLSLCREYELRDRRIRVFTQKNSGPSQARNVGIANAKGDYLSFIDADDYAEPSLLHQLVNVAELEQADFVMCSMVIDTYDQEGGLVSSVKQQLQPRILHGSLEIASRILDLVENESISGPWAKLIRASIVRENKISMPEHISLQEDLHFNLQVLMHVKKLCVLSDCLYHYIKRPRGSTTTRYYAKKYSMTNEVHNLLLQFYTSRIDNTEILARIQFIYVKNIYASCLNLFHRDCTLLRNEKIYFIREVVRSPKYGISIPVAHKKGLKFWLLKLVLLSKNSILIYYFSKFLFVLKFRLGYRYH